MCEHDDRYTQIIEETRKHFNEMLAHVPERLRQPLIDKYSSDTGTHNNNSCFFQYPPSNWALPLAEDCILQVAIIEFILRFFQ